MKYLFYVLLLISQLVNAQKHDYNWVYGGLPDSTAHNQLIQFNNSLPVTSFLTGGFVPFNWTNASYSDSSGNFLYSTNGIKIYNANFQPIPGADIAIHPFTAQYENIGFNWSNCFHFLPYPGDTNLCSLFYVVPDSILLNGPCSGGWSTSGFSYHLYYTILDKRLNNGLGGIVSANIIASNGLITRCGGLAPVKHSNGRDWWIIAKNACNSGFQTFLFSPSGVSQITSQPVGIPYGPSKAGVSAFSPDGSVYSIITGNNEFAFLQFDRCTGQLSNPLLLPSYNGLQLTSGEFSSNSQYFYTIILNKYIIQYDLSNYLFPGAVVNSAQVVGVTDTFSCPIFPSPTWTYLNQQRIGPDGIIYIAHSVYCNVLSTINSPDSLGVSCSPQFHNFNLAAGGGASLGTSINYRLGPEVGTLCDSLTVGNEDLKKADGSFKIYPNPTTDQLAIESKYHGPILIYDFLGQLVGTYEKAVEDLIIDVSRFSPGMYLIRTKAGAGYKFFVR